MYCGSMLLILLYCKPAKKTSRILDNLDAKDIKLYEEYYRDIPCNKNLFRAYYIAYEFDIIEKKTDFLGAIILDWLRKKKVSIEKRQIGIIRRHEETCIILKKNVMFENKLERELYKMMHDASKNGILEKNEFEKWCGNKYKKLLDWFEKVIEEERKELVKEGIIKKDKKFEIVNMDVLKNEGRKLKGLRNYLK